MSTESDLDVLAQQVRAFIDQEIPNVLAWNVNPTVLYDSLQRIGTGFTSIEGRATALETTVGGITLPGGALAPPAEWVREAATPTYVNASSFTLPGDQTGVYRPGARLRVTLGAAQVVVTLSTVTYNAGPGATTLVLTTPALSPALNALDHSLVRQSSVAVATADILDAAVTASKLAPGAVTTPAIAAGSVLSAAIPAGQITAAHHVPKSLTAAQIADGSLVDSLIAPATITGDKIAAGSLNGALVLAARSVGLAQLALGATVQALSVTPLPNQVSLSVGVELLCIEATWTSRGGRVLLLGVLHGIMGYTDIAPGPSLASTMRLDGTAGHADGFPICVNTISSASASASGGVSVFAVSPITISTAFAFNVNALSAASHRAAISATLSGTPLGNNTIQSGYLIVCELG
jgi:hypothetical protein